MASTEERIRELVDENLEVDGRPLGKPLDLNTNLIEAGVSSMDAVAFMQVVAKEFNVTIPPEECAKIRSVGMLIEYLDTHAG